MKTNNKLSIIVLLLLCGTMAMAQTVFRGTVIDATSGKPIPYVNVGVVKKGIGTVTDENGFLNLNYLSDYPLKIFYKYRLLDIPLRRIH